jgi:hypothetical protein
VISNLVFRYTLIVENVNPIIAASKEKIKNCGFSNMKQLKVPNSNDTRPESLNKFIL